ncbi:MAG: rRNA (Cytidine1920-2-O)/16S rRNA (Cytidine1409-2-O)-methyltransferase [Microbacteriaceae bacterium]|jgi:23S rRNA (cytidine1920-2'-O)/16S rRNA (cytidine1409-2'-O)-methyltransferase|nr:rRNA (Cytidine1920-2-O)/16S rRNA (Cytidine1409-2-O)-methyltransferase [Microbacteriaceae bacterium]
MADRRLDAAIADRGLARSRTQAARLIADGLVTVDGQPVVRASFHVDDGQRIEVAGADHYVSRAAHKLLSALDTFGVAVAGRLALDVGASTGGFTQVLLERGASRVLAVDVGHGQLAPSVRSDPRVTVIEGFNARFMTADLLAAERVAGEPTASAAPVDLVVADLSFISLPTVLPALVGTVGTGADYVLLVKPQFEVGRTGIREGIVRNAGLRTDAVNGVLWSAWDLALPTAGVCPSPIAGTNGNHEYLVWLSASAGSNPSEWSEAVTAMTVDR